MMDNLRSVHTDFYSIKKTLHNITEFKVVIFKVFIVNTNLIGFFFPDINSWGVELNLYRDLYILTN